MPREFAEHVIDTCVYAVLSTVGGDGVPYGVPLSVVRDGDCVYFHGALEGRKTDNLKRGGMVCLTCVGDVREPPDNFTVEYESAIVFGTAEELAGEAEKIRALRLLCERHTPANMAAFDEEIKRALHLTAVWKIRIGEISGKGRRMPH
jgi:nitroimidazol reductase NimA-like FMN-containing flavoprotein (pyridoxamine 5'-phosphate oxidase superfamily)